MKHFRLFLLLVAMCGSMTFAGCSDKGDNDSGDDASAILGTWLATSGYVCYGFTLQANGIGTEFEYSRENPDSTECWSIRYTYHAKNGILTTWDNSSGYKEVYRIISLTGSQMICELDDGGRHVYTRVG